MALHVSALRGHPQRLSIKRNLLLIAEVHTLALHGSNRASRHLTSSNRKLSFRRHKKIKSLAIVKQVLFAVEPLKMAPKV
jgi:hypothetical protein